MSLPLPLVFLVDFSYQAVAGIFKHFLTYTRWPSITGSPRFCRVLQLCSCCKTRFSTNLVVVSLFQRKRLPASSFLCRPRVSPGRHHHRSGIEGVSNNTRQTRVATIGTPNSP